MDLSPHVDNDELSDDEIFFGKLSLKEFKKHILWNKRHSETCNGTATEEDNHNESLKIIKTHSEPNLRPQKDISEPVCNIGDSDDSFLQMESMVSELCLSPRNKETSEEMNNTLEVIEYILNRGPTHHVKNEDAIVKDSKLMDDKLSSNRNQQSDSYRGIQPQLKMQSPPLSEGKANIVLNNSPSYFTPAKNYRSQTDVLVSPSVSTKPKSPVFKTPSNILSTKKPSASSLKKTPHRTNAYQHISSPVASYIKNCPQVPLLKDVHPKKPLPGPSSIPKFVRNPSQSKIQRSNKENIALPSIAYRCAKETKVIDLPDEEKLPQSEWVKKITSTLPRPMIMKHNHREMNVAKKKLLPQQEDSFADLTFHQADLSVCTQKTAFKPNKR